MRKIKLNYGKRDVTEKDLTDLIDQYNQDDAVDAIVLLQPLPLHLNPLMMAGKIPHDWSL